MKPPRGVRNHDVFSLLSVRQEGVLVPHVVRCCVEEVERRGMDEVGIYRISGAAGDISTLKAAFNSSKTATFPTAWWQESLC